MKVIYSFVLAVLLCTATVAQAQTPAMQQQPAPRPMPGPGAQVKPGVVRYPNIMDAQKALENAKMHLQKAPHDFGGHRAKAVEAIDKALAECKEAVKWADEHPGEPKK